MSSEKGQSIVELALVVPVVIMIILAIVDFGRIYHAYLTIDHAGREAARTASVTYTMEDNDVKLVAVNQGTDIGLSTSHITVTPKSNRSSGKDITVKITYPITFLTPIIGEIISPITLTDTTKMRVE